MSIIDLKNVGKKFIISYHKDAIGGNLFSKVSSINVKEDFWALRNINLTIEKGKIIGIVGRNGAGKSTLLNILAGLCPQTEGEVRVKGKVSNLLTLGAGFQEDLSGKENIFINASILGMDRAQMHKKFRSIVEFSELDGFLDVPIKSYSQGMQMRLGFSIAVHTDFDILLIDEVISVGDGAFQQKCYEKIVDFKRQGKNLVITTQSTDIIERLCDEVILLEDGSMEKKGSPLEVVNCYRKLLGEKKFQKRIKRGQDKELKWWTDKENWGKAQGTKEVKIISVEFLNRWGRRTNKFSLGDKLTIKVNFDVIEEIQSPHFGVAIFRKDGVYCYGPNTKFDGYQIKQIEKGRGWFILEYKKLLLMPGEYRLSVAIWDKKEVVAYNYHEGYYKITIEGANPDNQLLCLPYKWRRNETGCSEIRQRISAVFINEHGAVIDSLRTNTMATLRICCEVSDKDKKYLLKVSIFRQDGICCQGVSRNIDTNSNSILLVYPQIELLTGSYYVSAGIWEEGKGVPLIHQPKAHIFKVFFNGDDHGTVYLRHKWKLHFPKKSKWSF